MDNLIEIGFTHKPHGLKGEIKLIVNRAFQEDIQNLTVCFIKTRAVPVPYFVQYVKDNSNVIAKFEDVDSRSDAETIASKPLLARKSELSNTESEDPDIKHLKYSFLLGYSLIRDDKVLGTIEEIKEYPQQEMAIFSYAGSPKLLPLNDSFIQKIDESSKAVYVDLPEGLLDL